MMVKSRTKRWEKVYEIWRNYRVMMHASIFSHVLQHHKLASSCGFTDYFSEIFPWSRSIDYHAVKRVAGCMTWTILQKFFQLVFARLQTVQSTHSMKAYFDKQTACDDVSNENAFAVRWKTDKIPCLDNRSVRLKAFYPNNNRIRRM